MPSERRGLIVSILGVIAGRLRMADADADAEAAGEGGLERRVFGDPKARETPLPVGAKPPPNGCPEDRRPGVLQSSDQRKEVVLILSHMLEGTLEVQGR